MTHTFYQEILSEENNGNCIWYCNGCKKAIPGVRKVLNMVSLIKNSQDTMMVRIEKIESQLINIGPNSQFNTEFELDHAILDMKEREKRKNNVIIYNLPESNEESPEERKSHDDVVLKELCGSVKVNDIPTEITRLGVKSNTRSRPMRVVFENEQAKWKLLKNNYVFKDKIHTTPDYTYRQRQINMKMKEEVAKRRVIDQTFTFQKLKKELYFKPKQIQIPEQPLRTNSPKNVQSARSMRSRPENNVSPSQSPTICSHHSSQSVKYDGTSSYEGANGQGAPLGRGSGKGTGRGRGRR
ncbi:hypothetical protein DPMN_065653 [Dreissena polymorpha]|uniref:Uncharacterized protein n=1 Tax=Dreissena polymorpha TaxID=45954 RepID=A0A9D3YS13_DREPO|nr:hypothetical protein DPMN_065653 [Dreissena polymorpha]